MRAHLYPPLSRVATRRSHGLPIMVDRLSATSDLRRRQGGYDESLTETTCGDPFFGAWLVDACVAPGGCLGPVVTFFKIERKMFGREDLDFLERVFQKLLLNFTWSASLQALRIEANMPIGG